MQRQVAQPGVFGVADAVLAAGAAAVAQFQVGELPALGVGGEAVNRWPSRSVNRSWAPGCGRSLRTITRIPAGQPVRSSRPVSSATQAPAADLAVGVIGRGPGPVGEREDGVAMSSVMVKPTEYCRRRAGLVSQATNSWVPPPESVRISTRRRSVAGSWASASRATSMWSLAVFAPGVARPQQDGQRLPGAPGAVISEDSQRVEPERFLPSRERLFPSPTRTGSRERVQGGACSAQVCQLVMVRWSLSRLDVVGEVAE